MTACYACRLGGPQDAREWVKRACQIGDVRQIKAMALEDNDLEPIWPDLK